MTNQCDTEQSNDEEVSGKIFTIPNLISFGRLCLVPVFLYLLFGGENLWATLVYALAASTDWVDGQIARRTNQVSKLGQLLDPTVDRILMISGVLGLCYMGTLPIWIALLVLARDLFLIFAAGWLIRSHQIRIPVVFVGKLATTLLYIGFAGLLLSWPLFEGFGLIDAAWLPGFSSDIYSWGIWFVYVGVVLSLVTTYIYVSSALKQLSDLKHKNESV